MTEQHPDPGGEASARMAQLAAMTVSVGEALARLRAQRSYQQADVDRRDESAIRATRRIEAAQAAAVYRQATSPTWVRTADTTQLLTAWHCAGPFLTDDPTAHLAADRIEERLRQLHPEAMAVYDGVDLRDLPRDYRMQQASLLLRGPYGLDPIGTPIGQPAEHPQSEPTFAPDRAPATPARGPAEQAFPVPIREAMRTAPESTRTAIRAITAGPIRRQLTAAPHQPLTPRSTR